jgi:ADP-ribose pyrophosphatase
MQEIVGLAIETDQIVGREGGFLAIRRLRLRNRRADGSLSEPYLCDFIVRPYGLDAVVVALYHRTERGIEVLVRDGLRPSLALGRAADTIPVADERSYLLLTELVAGIIEEGDKGIAGIKQRAAAEVLEEAGYRVAADAIMMLGAATFPTAGAMPEKFWLTAVEVTAPETQEPLAGDGSPMEEGARTRWLDLGDAIAACVRGDMEDMKTELTLRRLRDALQTNRLDQSRSSLSSALP